MAFASGFGTNSVSSPTFRGAPQSYDDMFSAMSVGDDQQQQSYQQPPTFQTQQQNFMQGSGYQMQPPQQGLPQYGGQNSPYQQGYYQTPQQNQAPQGFNYNPGQSSKITAQAPQQTNYGLNPQQFSGQQNNPYGNYQSQYQPTNYAGQLENIQGQQAPGVQQGQQGGMSALDWYNMQGQQGQQGAYYGARVNPDGAPELMGTSGRQFDLSQTQLFRDSEEAARQLMSGQVPGYEESAAEAREALRAAQAARTANVRGDLINAGFSDSGRLVEEGVLGTANTDTAEMASLERGLAADKGALSMRGMQEGLGAAQGLMGQQQEGEKFFAQLGEGARQFDNQFEFEKWASERGFDENAIDRAWKDSQQERGISSTEKIAFAGLNQQERALAEDARQFDNRFEFDLWAEQNNMDENQRDRVWSAMMTEKTMAHERDLEMLRTDNDRWKVTQAENLTKLGWDQETALTLANMQANSIERSLDRQLDAQIAQGQLDSADKDRAQQAAQFKTKMDFDVWAEENNIAQADADRIWQSAEQAKDRTAVALEGSADRALQYEIQKGNLAVEEWGLALQAMQAADRLEFDAWATQAGLDDASAERIWRSTEAAKDRQLDVGLDYLDKQFQQKNMNIQNIMPFLETMDPEQAWGIVKQLSDEAGISIPEVFTSGNAYQSELASYTSDAVQNGTMSEIQALIAQEVSRTGIETYEEFQQYANDTDIAQGDRKAIWDSIKQTSDTVKSENNERAIQNAKIALDAGGKVDLRDARSIVEAVNAGNIDNLPFEVVTGFEDMGTLTWDNGVGDGKRRWVLSDSAKDWVDANTGKVVMGSNGRLYKVVGAADDKNAKKSSAYIKLRDVVTGADIKYANSSGTGGENRPLAGGGY